MHARQLGGLALITLLAAWATPLDAQLLPAASWTRAPLRFVLQPESRLWFEGDSSVRGFECEATALDGTSGVDVDGGELTPETLDRAVVGIELEIPVAGLECGNGTMNGHMRKALKAEAHPAIRYRHRAHDVVASPDGGAAVRLEGWLTIGGEEREVTLEGAAVVEPDGTLRVRGSHELDMTAFGVEPPSLMFGAIKVRDRVTVHFDMVLRP